MRAGGAVRVLAVAGAALAVGAPFAGAVTAADRAAGQRAATWLATTPAQSAGGQIADTMVALRAANRPVASLRPRLRALTSVAPSYATTAGANAKVVMGAIAGGADPSRLGGRDYVRGITARYADGRYGATAFDHALSILALRAAGRPIPRSAVRATLAARGSGGWSFTMSPSGRDSVDGTGLMIEALRAAGVPARHPELRAARTWMVAQRNREGGYHTAGAGRATQANPTSNVIRALVAMGQRPPAATLRSLRSLQQPHGAIHFTAGQAGSPLLATTDATVALVGRTLPIPSVTAR